MNTLKRQRGFVDMEWKDDGGDDKPPEVRCSAWQRFLPKCSLLLFTLVVGLLGLLGYVKYHGAESDVIELISILGSASTACLLFSFLVQTSVRPQD